MRRCAAPFARPNWHSRESACERIIKPVEGRENMLATETLVRRRSTAGTVRVVPTSTPPAAIGVGRPCNLLLVCKRRPHEHDDFLRIAEIIREQAPDVRPLVISDHRRNAFRPDVWSRPTLAVSTEGLRRFRPLRGRLFQGRQLTKSQEYTALERCGIPVPKWALFTADQSPDLADFGKYVVVKPDLGACGAEVKIKRKSRVSWKPIQTRYEGPSDLLVQEFIYTGLWPVCYRVSTFFGQVLASWRVEADRSRRPLSGPEAFAGGPQVGGISIASSGKGCTFELSDEPDVLSLGQQAHAAFPDWPLLGVDIVREQPTGRLFVVEVNSCGRTWHFSSARGMSIQNDFGFDLKAQFNALRKTASILIEKARLCAE
jgi:hypothetical protein